MLQSKTYFHGSDLETIEELYGIKKENLIPCAANVNPLGISPLARNALLENIDVIKDYPDRNYLELKQRISNYSGANHEHIIVGGGSTELIRLFIELIKPQKTMLLEPTYSEYAREILINQSEIMSYSLKESDNFELDIDIFLDVLNESIDLLILCNPNNPTSTSLTKEEIDKILSRCKQLDIFVMVDETYIEFVNSIDEISSVLLTNQYQNLIVVRSISKFFAAPGLRLGYAITGNEELLHEFERTKNPWAISTLAMVASIMFEDENYINLTKSLIHTERNLIYSALSNRKTIRVFKPAANFILLKLLKEDLTSRDVFEYCLQRNIMIRDCADFNGLNEHYIRFCFMKPEVNDHIVNTLLEVV